MQVTCSEEDESKDDVADLGAPSTGLQWKKNQVCRFFNKSVQLLSALAHQFVHGPGLHLYLG